MDWLKNRPPHKSTGIENTYPVGTKVVFTKDFDPEASFEDYFIPAGSTGYVKAIGPGWVEVWFDPPDPSVDEDYIVFTAEDTTLDQYLEHVRKASVKERKQMRKTAYRRPTPRKALLRDRMARRPMHPSFEEDLQEPSEFAEAQTKTAKAGSITESILLETILKFLGACNSIVVDMEDFAVEVNEVRATEELSVAPGTDEVMITLKTAKEHLEQAKNVFIEALSSLGGTSEAEEVVEPVE